MTSHIGQYAAGAATSGVYRGATTYAALADGKPHAYRFWSVGVDANNNTEAAPASPHDVVVPAHKIDEPDSLEVASLIINKNSSLTQRSYERYLDITFNRDDVRLADIAAGSNGSGLSLRWLGLDGLRIPEPADPVILSAPTTVQLNGTTISIDFGSGGIVTNAPAAPTGQMKGDGYYALEITVAGQVLDTLYFFRLLGDVTGDGQVTDADYHRVRVPTNATATAPTILNEDVNGSGRFDATDRSLVSARRNARAQVGTAPGAWGGLDALRLADRDSARGTSSSVQPLDETGLSFLVAAAIERWQTAGVSAADVRRLQALEVRVRDLPASTLGLYAAGVIYLDWTADGAGWFLDPTPALDEEYAWAGSARSLLASDNSPAADRVDLLTVLVHETAPENGYLSCSLLARV